MGLPDIESCGKIPFSLFPQARRLNWEQEDKSERHNRNRQRRGRKKTILARSRHKEGFWASCKTQARSNSLGAGLLLQKLREKTDQFQHILDFVNDPVPFALRSTEINTSSTPEEVESRKAEIRYQIQIMKSVLAVLAEELEELEQARPPLNVDKPV